MFKVQDLLKATEGRLVGGRREMLARSVSIDSRTLRPHEAFIAIKGKNYDGHCFIKEAVRKAQRLSSSRSRSLK